jgi:hypothetical protein
MSFLYYSCLIEMAFWLNHLSLCSIPLLRNSLRSIQRSYFIPHVEPDTGREIRRHQGLTSNNGY